MFVPVGFAIVQKTKRRISSFRLIRAQFMPQIVDQIKMFLSFSNSITSRLQQNPGSDETWAETSHYIYWAIYYLDVTCIRSPRKSSVEVVKGQISKTDISK